MILQSKIRKNERSKDLQQRGKKLKNKAKSPSPQESAKETLKSHKELPPKDHACANLKEIDLGAIHTMTVSGRVSCPTDQWLDLMEYVQ